MATTPIALYATQMQEIKLRINAIDHLRSGRGTALYRQSTVESIALQFRKILERIAFASLVANRREYEATYKNFATTWKADLLLRDLERVNPLFYPIPIAPSRDTITGSMIQHHPVVGEYLTKHAFVEVYEKCSGLLHALNPYRGTVSLEVYESAFPAWLEKIMRLLNSHEVHFVDDKSMWVINMQEDGDEQVHYYEFKRVPGHA